MIGGLHGRIAGEGPVAVFLHGGLLDHRLFDAQLDALDDVRRCIAVDLPGFGLSEPLSGYSMTLPLLAQAVIDALKAEKIDAFDLMGVSLGAGVAVEVAHQASQMVRSLCLVSLAHEPRAPTSIPQRLRNLLRSEGPQAVAESFSSRMLRPDAPHASIEHVRCMAGETSASTMSALFDLMENYPQVLPRLNALPHPTFVLIGGEDAGIDARALAAATSQSSNVTVRVVPSAGHLIGLDQPAAMNDAIRGFWRSRQPAL